MRRSVFQFISVFSVTSCKKLFLSRLHALARLAPLREIVFLHDLSKFMLPHLTRPSLSYKGIVLNIGENFSRQGVFTTEPQVRRGHLFSFLCVLRASAVNILRFSLHRKPIVLNFVCFTI